MYEEFLRWIGVFAETIRYIEEEDIPQIIRGLERPRAPYLKKQLRRTIEWAEENRTT